MRTIKSNEDLLRNIPYPDPTLAVQTEGIETIYTLQDYVFITDSDEIKVGVWDEAVGKWATEYIEDLVYDKSTRQLKFLTKKFGPIAYIQPKTLDFPYDSWYIRCIDN